MRHRSPFPPHHCSPPAPVQLSFGKWEIVGASGYQLTDTISEYCFILHHQLTFPSLSHTFLKIGQGSASSTTFNKQAPHKVACLSKRCERGLPTQRHQFKGVHAPIPGPRTYHSALTASRLLSPPCMSGQLSTRVSLQQQSCSLCCCESCWELPGWRGQGGICRSQTRQSFVFASAGNARCHYTSFCWAPRCCD